MNCLVKRTPLAAAMLLALQAPLYSPQVLAAPGDAAGSEFPVNIFTTNAQVSPGIAVDAQGDFAVAWASHSQDSSGNYGVFVRLFQADGTALTGEIPVNTWTTNNQAHPGIAMDADGDFVVVWDSAGQDGDGYGVYAQRFSAGGTAAGSEFKVNTYTTGNQRNPSIALDADGDFVIAWESYGQDGGQYGIYAQRYSADGTPAGVEFRVNSYTTVSQINASVALDANGDLVIAWQSYGQDGDMDGIYAQRYHASGLVNGGEFQVNTWTTGIQSVPDVAMDAAGDFIITWQSAGQDGDGTGIYAQRYSADGLVNGSEFVVNTVTTNSQYSPAAAMDADGDFAISWESNLQDGAGFAAVARRYSSTGMPEAVESVVNTYTTSDQFSTSLAMDADGDFIVAWQSFGQDASNYGIFAQRIEGAGNFAAGPIDLNMVVTDDIDPVALGNNFVYSLMTTNPGTGIALDVNLSETIPAGLSYVSDDAASGGWTCSQVAATLSCNKPFMNAGETSTISLTVSADSLGMVNNTVTVNAAQTDVYATDNSDTESTDVTDQVAPVITLVGSDPFAVRQHTTFTDPGVTVTDNVDTGLTATVSGTVDINTPGSYLLSYNVSDTAGNAATTVTRTVVVVDAEIPVITLLGDNPLTVTKNKTYTDPGTTVTDNVDTGLVATLTGRVDTSTVGTYILSYDVSDSAGNAAVTVTRTVNVVAPSSGGGGALGVFSLLLVLPLWLRRRILKQ